jgi:hypothetical protein
MRTFAMRPENVQSMNSAVKDFPAIDLRVVETEQRSKRAWPGRTARMSASSKRHSAEGRSGAGREQRLEAAVERLSAEVALLEGAAFRRERVESGAPEVGVTDRDAVEHQDALNGVYLFTTPPGSAVA